MDGIQLPQGVVPHSQQAARETHRQADAEISPGSRVGTWEILHLGSREEVQSEAKFNLKH